MIPLTHGPRARRSLRTFSLAVLLAVPGWSPTVHAQSASADYRLESAAFGSGSGLAESADYRGELRFGEFGPTQGTGSASADYSQTVGSLPPVNEPPTVQGLRVTLDAGAAIDLVLVASDPEGEPLVWTIRELPLQGTVSGRLPEVRYQATAGRVGADRFVVRVTDAAGATAEATIELVLREVERPEPELDVRITAEGVVVQGTAVPGTYQVEASEDLVSWIVLDRVVAGGGTVRWTDAGTAGRRYRFYRLRPDSGGPGPFRIEVARALDGTALGLRAVVEAGTYRLEASRDLVTWSDAGRQTVPSGEIRFAPSTGGGLGSQFFRIVRDP